MLTIVRSVKYHLCEKTLNKNKEEVCPWLLNAKVVIRLKALPNASVGLKQRIVHPAVINTATV